ncbi:glycosyltransferase family 4 protein, partial [Patescibacteria group bacterium]|nr:glycosyltransferase family 4 protein [Patescibacteria group bacterium]
NTYVVYLDCEPNTTLKNELFGKNLNFTYKIIKKTFSWTQVDLATELFKNPVDVFFTPVHTIPGFHPIKTKIVVMIHGLEYKINKQYAYKPIHQLIHPIVLWWTMKFAHKIVVPSLATKEAITGLGWPGIDFSRLTVIPEGVSQKFYKRAPIEIAEVRKKYNLGDNQYIFFLSTIQPRKNLVRTIEAFSRLLNQHSEHSNLLLVIGGKNGWDYEESLAAPKKFGVEGNVIFLGHVDQDNLPKLMSGARAYVNCSLEEGFGLPLIEAMACETPVVVSDIPAFKEIAQTYAYYTNPLNVEDIKSALEKALNGAVPEQVQKAKKLTYKYTWQETARQLLDVIKSRT